MYEKFNFEFIANNFLYILFSIEWNRINRAIITFV